MRIGQIILAIYTLRYAAQIVWPHRTDDIWWGWFGVIWCLSWLAVLLIADRLTRARSLLDRSA